MAAVSWVATRSVPSDYIVPDVSPPRVVLSTALAVMASQDLLGSLSTLRGGPVHGRGSTFQWIRAVLILNGDQPKHLLNS